MSLRKMQRLRRTRFSHRGCDGIRCIGKLRSSAQRWYPYFLGFLCLFSMVFARILGEICSPCPEYVRNGRVQGARAACVAARSRTEARFLDHLLSSISARTPAALPGMFGMSVNPYRPSMRLSWDAGDGLQLTRDRPSDGKPVSRASNGQQLGAGNA